MTGPAAAAAPARRDHRPLPLFLLPQAGGSAAVFRGWRQAFPPEVLPCPVELPGRGARISDPAVTELGALVAGLDQEHRPGGGGPWAVLGHSMGALAAAAWAVWASQAGHPPCVLYISAAAPPWLVPAAAALAGLDDGAFWRRMTALGGLPPTLTPRPSARRLLVRIMRGDVQAAASWRPAGPVQAGCPIVAFCGWGEPGFSHDQLAGWQQASAGGFQLRLLPGGHFYTAGLADLIPPVREDITPRVAGLRAIPAAIHRPER